MPLMRKIQGSGSQRRYDPKIIKYTSVYFVISCVWILFSDKLVALADPSTFQLLSTAKGWLFVAVTATLLYFMMVRHAQRIVLTEAAHTVLFNYAADSILISDESGRILDVNINAEELLGYSRNELLKMGFADLVMKEELAREPLERGELAEGRSVVLERRYIRKGGTTVPVEINATRLPERKHLAIVRDITNRKLMEDALLQSEQQNRAIVHAVPDLLFRIDKDGAVLEFLAGEESQLFVPADDILGKNLKDILPPDVASSALQAVHKTSFSGRMETFEYSLSLNGTLRFYEGRIVPLSETEVLSVIRDITDRRKAEEERNVLEKQLQQSQKIESLGTLAAGIAHDFNNILNIIMGNTTLLMTRDRNTDKTHRRIQAILEATERGSKLVNQLLTFARKSEIRRQSVLLNDFIRDTSRLLEETFPKTVVLEFNLEPNIPPVIADPNQLNQVLLNLSLNARDAMPEGGRLVFTTRYVSVDEMQRQFRQAPPQSYVCFTVSDNGSGMDEATRSRIFDPFFTTKETGKGTGLGLAVALGIIQSHNGFVDVKSECGIGSTFSVYLPAGKRCTHDGLDNASKSVCRVGRDEVVLFIEDEAQALEATSDFLLAGGFLVLKARDAEEGLELFKLHENKIALVLSDYGLPKYNGEEVFSRLRKINPVIRFILLTGYLDPEKRERVQRMGVREIITKPYRPAELLHTIRSVLDQAA